VANSDYDYRATTCSAYRTFRLLHPLPAVAEFFATQLTLDLYQMPFTSGAEFLMASLPWQDVRNGRELGHAGHNVIRRSLASGYDVACGSLAEVLFLRLARQGDAVELAGPHCKVPQDLIAKINQRRHGGSA